MGKKYIIELLDDCQSEFKGIMAFGMTQEKQISVELITEEGLRPYTEPDLEQVMEEAYEKGYEKGFIAGHLKAEKSGQSFYEDGYQCGLNDAWDTVRKIRGMTWNEQREVFGTDYFTDIIALPASECIEKIRQYEQEKEEQEKERSVTAEDVMRQYLYTFCINSKGCAKCPLNTPDFTCGRGYHFLGKCSVSDEEVRRAYAAVLAKMKEADNG